MSAKHELPPFFQFLSQVSRLSSDKSLYASDLEFLVKQSQSKHVWIQKPSYVLTMTLSTRSKQLVPGIIFEHNVSKKDKSIESIDFYFSSRLMDYKNLEKMFGSAHFGLYLCNNSKQFIPETHISIWNLYGSTSNLLIAPYEVNSRTGLKIEPYDIEQENHYYSFLRLVLIPIEHNNINWSLIRTHSKRIAEEQSFIDLTWELFYGASEPKKAPVVSMAKEREKRKEKIRQTQQQRWRHKRTIAFVDELLHRAFVDYSANYVHLYKESNHFQTMFRQNRQICFQQTLPGDIERQIIRRLKTLFRLEITPENKHGGFGRYKFPIDGDNSVQLTAQVTPGNYAERMIIYQEFKEYSLKTEAPSQKNIRAWFLQYRDQLPLQLPLKNLDHGSYTKLCAWVDILSKEGFTILLTSKARLPLPLSGHTKYEYEQYHTNEELIKRIINVFDFDLHIDIQSIKEPLKFHPKKEFSEYFCTHCNQCFVTYRKPKRSVSCPVCHQTDYPPIHNMNSFGFSYYLMSVEAKEKMSKAKDYWILDDGCRHYRYDKSPLLDDATLITHSVEHQSE